MFHVQNGADIQAAQTDKGAVWPIPPTDYITRSVRNENLTFKETDSRLVALLKHSDSLDSVKQLRCPHTVAYPCCIVFTAFKLLQAQCYMTTSTQYICIQIDLEPLSISQFGGIDLLNKVCPTTIGYLVNFGPFPADLLHDSPNNSKQPASPGELTRN